jgi:molybdate transport system substrate-binding protein
MFTLSTAIRKALGRKESELPSSNASRSTSLIVICTIFFSVFVGQQVFATQVRSVTVFAAASLKTALDSAAADWTGQTSIQTRIVYGASSILARQIEQGAPADVFLSANIGWIEYLIGRNIIDPASRIDLFGNSLVLIAPASRPVAFSFKNGADLPLVLGGGRLAMANTSAVPAGLYGKQSLVRIGIWEMIRSKLAETQDVRGALSLVARGEAPLGIVYATDASAEPKVRIVATLPDETHDAIVYPAGLVGLIARSEAAAFLKFLASDAGAAHFISQGFVRLR